MNEKMGHAAPQLNISSSFSPAAHSPAALIRGILTITIASLCGSAALATIPYGDVTLGIPSLSPTPSLPSEVFGKEFSHDRDYEISPPGTAADPQQLIAWDGSGGVANSIDYSGTRIGHDDDDDIDAIANHRDALFSSLVEDRAHLLFSLDDVFHTVTPSAAGPGAVVPMAIPPGTPPGVTLGNGNTVGGAGEVSVEWAHLGGINPGDKQTLWAEQKQVNGMPLPLDVDGLEVWGPEPGADGDPALSSDTDKYSLFIDAFSGAPGGPPAVSVWNGGALPGAGTPYILHSMIAAAVQSAAAGLGGPIPATALLPLPGGFLEGEGAINVDALIVQDRFEDPNKFEVNPTGGPGDRILFSIRQIVDPADPDGFYATGSELWVLDASGAITPLVHGDHTWDHTYAKAAFGGVAGAQNEQFFAYDINALEAIGGAVIVPAPAACWLLLTSMAPALLSRRQRG